MHTGGSSAAVTPGGRSSATPSSEVSYATDASSTPRYKYGGGPYARPGPIGSENDSKRVARSITMPRAGRSSRRRACARCRLASRAGHRRRTRSCRHVRTGSPRRPGERHAGSLDHVAHRDLRCRVLRNETVGIEFDKQDRDAALPTEDGKTSSFARLFTGVEGDPLGSLLVGAGGTACDHSCRHHRRGSSKRIVSGYSSSME